MGCSNSRLSGAVQSIREAIAAAAEIDFDVIGGDEDLIDDLGLDNLELVSLALIVEEIFAVSVPDNLFQTPLYRTASSLAEWAIRQSDQGAWAESRQARRVQPHGRR